MKGERRRSERRRVAAFAALVAVGRHGSDQSFSAVVDISRNGICVRTGQPPLVGQTVLLRLAIGEDIHVLGTRVTRVRSRPGGVHEVGLDWTQCSAEDLQFLDEYLASA